MPQADLPLAGRGAPWLCHVPSNSVRPLFLPTAGVTPAIVWRLKGYLRRASNAKSLISRETVCNYCRVQRLQDRTNTSQINGLGCDRRYNRRLSLLLSWNTGWLISEPTAESLVKTTTQNPQALTVTPQGTEIPPRDSQDLRVLSFPGLAMSWTGLAASSAAIARSGTGGIGAATPRKPVAKIALVLRKAVGCRRPHWVFIEGAPGKARCV
jgi:hypothetical protein